MLIVGKGRKKTNIYPVFMNILCQFQNQITMCHNFNLGSSLKNPVRLANSGRRILYGTSFFCVKNFSIQAPIFQNCSLSVFALKRYSLGRASSQGSMNSLQVFQFIPKKKVNTDTHFVSAERVFQRNKIEKRFKARGGSSLQDKFIKLLTIDGKKSKAYALFFKALRLCQVKLVTGKYTKNVCQLPTKILCQAVKNIKPSVEIRKVRIAASTYQVPAITPKTRQERLAIRWIILSAQKRKKNTKNTFSECLAQELVESFLKQGQSRQKRDQLHSTAESNRAFARYKWW